MVFDNILVEQISLREAARGYVISLRASRYSPRYVESVEMCLRFLSEYAEARGWPEISRFTASHIEEYLVYLQEKPRRLGNSDQRPVSASSVETHYRRIKTFFCLLIAALVLGGCDFGEPEETPAPAASVAIRRLNVMSARAMVGA